MTRDHIGKAFSGDAAVSKTAERGSIPRAGAMASGPVEFHGRASTRTPPCAGNSGAGVAARPGSSRAW